MVSKTVIGLLVTAVLVVAAVSGGVYLLTRPPPPPAEEKVVIVGISGTPLNLDAPGWTGVQWHTVAWVLYDRLVEIDENLNVVPGLAKSWTVSTDGLTWTFYLRSGVKFHDGTDFNAEAVKFNIDRIINEQLPNAYRLFMNVTKTTVINSTVIQFTTGTSYAPLLTNLAYVVAGISSPTALQAHPGNYSYYASGTGPYKLVSYIPGSKIEFVANKDYWGPKPQLDKLTFLVVTDPSTRVIALKRGDVQLVDTVPLDQYDSLKSIGSIDSRVIYERSMYVALDSSKFNKNVRLAMNYAINKTAIIEGLFKGTAKISRTSIPPLTVMAINDLTPYPYNPGLARQLLAEAGYPNGLNVTLEATSGRYLYDKEVAQVIQSQLAAVGIKVTIVINEYSTHTSRLRNTQATHPQMSLIGWGASTGDPDYFLLQFYYGKVQPPLSNNGFYRNSTIDSLIERGAAETGLTKRTVTYAEIQRLIWADAPSIFLYTQPTIYAWSDQLHGVQIMPTGAVNMRGAYLQE